MKPLRLCLTPLLAGTLMASFAAQAVDPEVPAPPLREVLELLDAHLEGVSAVQLESMAVRGLIERLAPRVQLVDPGAVETVADPEAPPVAVAERVGKGLAYLRLTAVRTGAAAAVEAQLNRWAVESPPEGLVLDLRFAGGLAYDEVIGLAGLFLDRARPLFDAGEGMRTGEAHETPFTAPVVVLINGGTSGAAEILAAVLRHTETALTIGNRTAGRAHRFEAFTLSNEQRLRIATGSILMSDGRGFPGDGLPADLAVSVTLADERQYLAQLEELLRARAKALESGRSARLNEADLVAIHREGLQAVPGLTAGGASEPAPSRVSDPTLERALDLLTGLAVVRASTPR